MLRFALSRVANTHMSNCVGKQALLPVKNGGLGITKAAELAPSAYLASVHSVYTLVSGFTTIDFDTAAGSAIELSSMASEAKLPAENYEHIQQMWYNPMVL